MGGLEGKPNPGGAQTVRLALGEIQVQPVFPSVVSVTPGEIVCVVAEETSRGTNWASSTTCDRCTDAIALGRDGDVQPPNISPPNTTNRGHTRVNTFTMWTAPFFPNP